MTATELDPFGHEAWRKRLAQDIADLATEIQVLREAREALRVAEVPKAGS